MKEPIIDVTIVTADDTVVDAAALDRARAHRVVAYIRHRFPAVRYNDAPGDLDDPQIFVYRRNRCARSSAPGDSCTHETHRVV